MKKKMNDKGFTLVELIVVLVILAILAAILVPALLGYIDRAKESQIVLNAKSCLTAAQAEASSLYAQGKNPNTMKDLKDSNNKNRVLATADVLASCDELVVGFKKAFDPDNIDHDMYVVSYVKYTEGGKTIYFDGSEKGKASWDGAAPTATVLNGTTIKAASGT